MPSVVAVGVLLLACSLRAQTTQQTDPEREFATFGVKAVVSANWKRLAEDSPDTIAKWGVGGSAGQPDVIVIAALETSRGKSLKSYSEDIAKKTVAEVRQETAGLGEDPTWKIIYAKTPAATGPQPSATLVAVHEEHLYRVTSFAMAPSADADGALEELRRGWSFCAITRPAQCVTLRDEPVTYLDRLTVRPPAVLRPKALPVDGKGKALEFQTFNYRSGRADMVMTMEVDKRPAKKTLEELGQQLIAQMNLKQDPEHPIKWKKIEGERDAVICNSFPGAKSGSRTVPLRFALVDLGENQVVLLGFVFPTGDDTDREIYEDLTETMAQTVRPVKK
jgi:hypothetical protein